MAEIRGTPVSEEYLREVRISHVMDCLADPSKIRVLAYFSRDVGEALPYLAALLPQAGYHHEAGILTFVREGRMISIYPRTVMLAKALDEADAAAILEWLRGKINEGYARRAELTPCYERRRVPRFLDVYRLLPRGNCGRCGEVSCLAFAVRLAFGEAHIGGCPRLLETEFARNRSVLVEWLGADA
jgi:ArsR family metal-binding transcriptional regulator